MCGDSWTNDDAQVACRHLGFPIDGEHKQNKTLSRVSPSIHS